MTVRRHRLLPTLLVCIALVAAACNIEHPYNNAGWHTTGLTGGGFLNVVAMAPNDPRHVLAGADVSGIFYSEDGGASWQIRNDAAFTNGHLRVASIVWHPTIPGHAYTLVGDGDAGSGGLLVTDDDGWTWRRASTVPTGAGNNVGPNRLGLPATHPRSIGRLLAVDAGRGLLYAATFDRGVLRARLSDLSDRAWQSIGLSGQYVRSIALDRRDPTVLYASAHSAGANAGKVFRVRSADAAASVAVLSGSPVDAEEILSLDSGLYGVANDPAPRPRPLPPARRGQRRPGAGVADGRGPGRAVGALVHAERLRLRADHDVVARQPRRP